MPAKLIGVTTNLQFSIKT